jgi:RNA 2',3'-cyclic 3'-phosphodiesterase
VTGERPASLRLFVAVELPEAWLKALRGLQEHVKRALAQDAAMAGVRVRWVRPEGIHLTLKFIGGVAPERLDLVREHMQSAVPEAPGIRLRLAGVGSFEDRRAPRVIWVGVQDEPQFGLLRLAESIETWLGAAGVPRERRGFRPHLTLARLPDDLSQAQRQRAADLARTVRMAAPASFAVDHVSLMQSFLGPGGARYERLGQWPDDQGRG